MTGRNDLSQSQWAEAGDLIQWYRPLALLENIMTIKKFQRSHGCNHQEAQHQKPTVQMVVINANWTAERLIEKTNRSRIRINEITVLAKKHALFHLTLKTHYEDTFRRHVAPHCLVTPHFPVTPHFGAALFGATLFGDATFSCGATFWRRIVWRHIAWRRHIFLWRHILAPHCLAPHCLVTPHFPVTPHFGATFFGDTLFGDATLEGVTLHRWAWSWLEWFRLGVGSVGKNAPVRGVFLGAW